MTQEQIDRIVAITTRIEYRNWLLRFSLDKKRGNAPFIQWVFEAKCRTTGYVDWQYSRKWYLSEHMTESEIVLTAFKAAITAEEHECRENFLYQSRRVMNPHISIQALMSVCDQEDVRDEPGHHDGAREVPSTG